jgi:hypothetical protein
MNYIFSRSTTIIIALQASSVLNTIHRGLYPTNIKEQKILADCHWVSFPGNILLPQLSFGTHEWKKL